MAGIALCLLAILFVAINALAGAWLTSARIDLTEDRLYTLSDSTRSLLASVNEPITFRFYLSSALAQHVPMLGIYAGRVHDLLTEYENISGGMVRVEKLDPAPFSDIEDRAVAAGLNGIPAVTGGDNLYFGLVGTNTTDDRETIPFMRFDRESVLEYDISQMLYALATPEPTVVGILSSLPTDGTMRMNATGQQEAVPPYVIRSRLGQLFETQFLGRVVDEVPADVDVLLIVHPKGFSPNTLFAIDQFLLGGGKAMIFVDPYAEAEGMEGQMVGTTIDGSTLDPLFAAWGLAFDSKQVVGDRLTARKVLAQDQNRPVEYIPWLELRGPNISAESPITSGISTVAVASAGHIGVMDGATISLEPLLTTSQGSALFDSKMVQGFRDAERLLQAYEPTGDRYVIAGRVTGMVETAFPNGVPAGPDSDAKDAETAAPTWTRPVLATSSTPLDVIVIADADSAGRPFLDHHARFCRGTGPCSDRRQRRFRPERNRGTDRFDSADGPARTGQHQSCLRRAAGSATQGLATFRGQGTPDRRDPGENGNGSARLSTAHPRRQRGHRLGPRPPQDGGVAAGAPAAARRTACRAPVDHRRFRRAPDPFVVPEHRAHTNPCRNPRDDPVSLAQPAAT